MRAFDARKLLRCSAGFFLIYLVFMNPSPDTSYTLPHLHLAVSLVDNHSVALSSYRGYDVAMHEGRFLSGHPPGAAFLSAAVYQVFRPLFPPEANDRTIFRLNTLSIVLISIPLSVLAALVFHQMVLGLTTNPGSVGWAWLLMAFGTASFAYSGAFYKKGILGSVALLAMVLIWSRAGKGEAGYPRGDKSALRLFLAGWAAGFCVVLDYPFLLWFPFLFIYLWRKKVSLSGIIWFLVGSGLMALLLLFYHQAAFGDPFRSSYSLRFPLGDGVPNFTGISLHRLWQILLGVQCGLFLYEPILVVSVLGWWVAVRDRIFREEMVWLIGAPSIAYLLFYSFWSTGYWCGGESLDVRMMVPLFPLVMLPVAVGWDRIPRRLSLALAALSLFFAYLGALSFFSPAASVPFVYTAKNAFVSLGSGEMFSRFLPSLFGLQTPLSMMDKGGISEFMSDPARLFKLMGTQLLFSIVQFALLAGIWRVFLGNTFLLSVRVVEEP